jgi:hypothetical protein
MGCNESVGGSDRAGLPGSVRVGDSLDAWLSREILSHETTLVRYLTRAWFARDEFMTCGKKSIYTRGRRPQRGVRAHQKLCFSLPSGDLVADRVRRKRIVSIEPGWDFDAFDVLIDEISPGRCTRAHQDGGVVEVRRLFLANPDEFVRRYLIPTEQVMFERGFFTLTTR